MKKDGIQLIFAILLLLFIPSASQSTDMIIKIKVNKIGSVQLLNSSIVPNPDQIRVNFELKGTNANTITIDNIEDEIELIWESKLNNCNSMFMGIGDITEIDFSSFDSIEVTDMQLMFANCISLTSINFANFYTDNVVNMDQMFFNCRSLTSLDVSNFQTSKVKSMVQMFAYCNSLESLNLSNFNTQSSASFLSMFRNCFNLKFLNLSGMVTNKGINFGNMFYNCYSLKSLEISHFETGNILRASYMFYNCSSLTSLNLSNFIKENDYYLIMMDGMFQDCKNLQYLNIKGKSNALYTNILDNTPENMMCFFSDNRENRDLRAIF